MAGTAESVSQGSLGTSLAEKVRNSRILVVGAGGIGCELLKNIVLTGFRTIEVIDLDTIDVSNLNRQFLFHKKHVGQSKAKVARESALSFNPDVNIKAHHDSVMSSDYGVDFFRQFDLVMNALDNRAARNHVNRMCLAADIPLVESGTAGYLGQVTVIRKGLTECYECQPKPTQKSFPGCTIRNTPSEPIHCIVWAKHLFNQLFGEADADEEVSPDTEDPEAAAEAGERALQNDSDNGATGGVQRASTRAWAEDTGYDSAKLFNKLFCDDIKYLLSMDKLWKKRTPPTSLLWDEALSSSSSDENSVTTGLQDQRVWSIQECANIFGRSVDQLKMELANKGEDLVWDKTDTTYTLISCKLHHSGLHEVQGILVKENDSGLIPVVFKGLKAARTLITTTCNDDSASMDFVTCTANIRAHCFGIAMKSRFDIKSMAGNIIPAIATTNAIIAGVIVMQALSILVGQMGKCKTIYLNRQPNPRKKLLVPCSLAPPNPKCYVCAAKPEVTVILNTTTLTVKMLEEKILKERFAMVAPDVEIEDGKGTILISSEEGETEENSHKQLSVFGINSGSRLKADDFLQNYELIINIKHVDKLENDLEFEVQGDLPEPMPTPSSPGPSTAQGNSEATDGVGSTTLVQEEAEEVMIMDHSAPSRKRKVNEIENENESEDRVQSLKRARTGSTNPDDELIVL